MATLTRAKLTLDEREARWADIYAQREALLSASGDTAYLLVPMADQTHDTGLVVTTVGTEQADFTYSQSQSVFDFDTPPSYIGPWGIPVISFNGSDEWLETPDASFWTDSAGSSEPSYCWAFWLELVANGGQTLMSKTEQTGAGGVDWNISLTASEQLLCRIWDDSANAHIGQLQDAGISEGWHHFAITKHDDAATSASIILYVDGVAVVDSASETGTYIAQEDGTLAVRIGVELDNGVLLASPMAGACAGPIFRAVGTNAVWTPDQILRDYQIGRALLGPAAGL